MSWIESHQKILNHPKLKDLMDFMEWDIDTAIGKLHRFWWWCVDYAEDGDLRRHNDNRIGFAIGLNSEDSKRFVEAAIKSCWIDREPYFRVHDWWDWAGRFLQSRYSHTPDKWQSIRLAYAKQDTPIQPNQTKPNQTKHLDQSFLEFWQAYPRKCGKLAALKVWNRIKPDTALVEKIIGSVEAQKKSEQWCRDGGQFIPHPSTWLNQGRWDDEIKPSGITMPRRLSGEATPKEGKYGHLKTA